MELYNVNSLTEIASSIQATLNDKIHSPAKTRLAAELAECQATINTSIRHIITFSRNTLASKNKKLKEANAEYFKDLCKPIAHKLLVIKAQAKRLQTPSEYFQQILEPQRLF